MDCFNCIHDDCVNEEQLHDEESDKLEIEITAEKSSVYKYNHSPRGKAASKRYAKSEKGKATRRKNKKKYYERNKEKIAEKKHEYYLAHKEKILAKNKENRLKKRIQAQEA